MTWRNGHYFQVLEGPAPAVDSLYAKISQDNRHTELETVWVEHDVLERVFSGWRLKLWSASLSCNEVNRYIRLHEDRFDTLDASIRQRLGKIFQLDLIFNSEPGDLPDPNALAGYEYRLQALPSVFGFSGQHPRCIDVLTALLSGWASAQMLSQRFGMSLDELYSLLSRGEVNALLLKRKAESSQDRIKTRDTKPRGPSTSNRSFYDSLRAFFLASQQ